MPELTLTPPLSPAEPVTEILHGVPITDPYRWLEDQNSPRTRGWIEQQTQYARAYLDNIPGRERIRQRIRDFLAIETYDSLHKVGNRYFFRKRLPDQEQPCIYMREGADGQDQLLVDPAERGTGKYTALKPLCVSPDGRLLLYEIKEGGERTGAFALLDIESRSTLPDVLSRGYLRGLVFAPDCKSFYYVHQALEAPRPAYRAVYYHVLGTPFCQDHEVFRAGEDSNLRLFVFRGERHVGIFVSRCADKTYTDFYLQSLDGDSGPRRILANAVYSFDPILLDDRILAVTDRDAPNLHVVCIHPRETEEPQFVEIVPELDVPIHQWAVVGEHIFVCYTRRTRTEVRVYELDGRKRGEVPVNDGESLRLVGPRHGDELLFEAESFTEPMSIWRYAPDTGERTLWTKRSVPFDSTEYAHTQFWYTSKDGTQVPMFLMGHRNLLAGGCHPVIMTSYGGHGVSMTPQFSVLVSSLVERGCLFALPCIRGGSEFGVEWHDAAKRRKRQNAYNDFLSAAEWLFKTGRTTPDKLAIFGASNAGLLVGAALTQGPSLFRAAVCMVPMLDMLRYHLFDEAHIWKDEFGVASDPDDFAALESYSPYHRVEQGVAYPATMIISGDADTNCNPLHARKMTARLQAANASHYPIILAYSRFRGHSPVLPLSVRIESLTDRIAFLCDQLRLPV
jgi:prolyl oligopeptidase